MRTESNVSRQFVDSFGESSSCEEELLLVVQDRQEANFGTEYIATARNDGPKDGRVLERIRNFDSIVNH